MSRVNGAVPRISFRSACGDGWLLQFLGIGELVGHLAQSLVDLLLELAHTAFSGVVLDDALDGCLVEAYLRGELVETCILQFLRNQVALGNLSSSPP